VAAEPLSSIVSDIIGKLSDIKGVSNVIGDKLLTSGASSEKCPQQEPCNLEQALNLARSIARESFSKLSDIVERL
jgi:hypothetical protein